LGRFQAAEVVGPALRGGIVPGGVDGGNEGLADTAAHLAGGAVGERDGDDLTDFGTIAAEVRQVAFGEHTRLAAAGAGGQDDGCGAPGNGVLLLGSLGSWHGSPRPKAGWRRSAARGARHPAATRRAQGVSS